MEKMTENYCLWIQYEDNSVGFSNHATIKEAETALLDEMMWVSITPETARIYTYEINQNKTN